VANRVHDRLSRPFIPPLIHGRNFMLRFIACCVEYPEAMELVNSHHRPHRAVIRCKVMIQLLEMADDCFESIEPGENALLEELAATLFQSERYRAMYQQCRSRLEAEGVGDRLVNELVETYRDILKRRQDPVVQSFNTLL
jgi:hypothetical protein